MYKIYYYFLLGLRLTIEGVATCEWKQNKTTYFGSQIYLNTETYLFGSKNGESMEVPTGLHTYNFESLLPDQIPYSAEGFFGHIRYKVDVNLDIPWAPDFHCKKPFYVTRYDNLSLLPEMSFPCEQEEVKVFCCLCCAPDPLIVRVRLPHSGFGLGEIIPIQVELINNSRTDVVSTEFTLKKTVKCTSDEPSVKTQSLRENIVVKSGRGCRAGQTVLVDETLEIPQVLMMSNDRFCRVFQILYQVKVVAKTSCMSFSPKVKIPITIGSLGIGNSNKIASEPKIDQVTRKIFSEFLNNKILASFSRSFMEFR